MMLRRATWLTEAADLILKGMDGAINAKTVTLTDFCQADGRREGSEMQRVWRCGDCEDVIHQRRDV